VITDREPVDFIAKAFQKERGAASVLEVNRFSGILQVCPVRVFCDSDEQRDSFDIR
jgi:hypothetical protein